MAKPIITISREYGSGGTQIAQKLSQRLGIPCYDRDIISKEARESGLADSYIHELSKQKNISFLYNIYMSSQEQALPDEIFRAESQVIKRMAQDGSCILLGRCADDILRDEANLLRIFVYAPLESRITRALREYKVQTRDIETFVLRKDNDRSSYYGHFTMKRWGDYANYDLSVNSDIGIENAVDMLELLIKKEEEC